MKWYMKFIKHKHNFIPIVYGLLMVTVNKNNKIIEPKNYYPGGCVVREEKYICMICGKRIK